MGRTNATYRNHLDSFIERFKPFRKGLRKENKEYVDMLWEKAHSYASAGAYMNPSNPGLPAMISIMLGLQKDIDQLENRLDKLEEKLEA
ncbi:MAG: hypothetical protein ABEK10_04175 [Candidatus Nanosalina sp.]